jgi:alpha-L-fucosidase
LYYSLVDWHHGDYPAWQDRQHPRRHDPGARERDAQGDWSRYVAYLHGQVEELCRNYGTIDLLVFDFSYWDYAGEKWGASELMRRIRALQPDVVVNDRLGLEALKQVPRPDYAGDFDQTEQDIPREPLTDRTGRPIPWESWFTLNNSWCFDPNDRAWKDSTTVIRALVNCVSKDGNLTLNVSPDVRGNVPAAAVGILREVGAWLDANGESIRGAGAAPWPKPEWGRFTLKGDRLYAHVLEPAIGHLTLPGLRGSVKNGRVLATGAEAILCDYWNPGIQTFDAPDDIFFNFGCPVQATFPLPDRRDSVVGFELTGAEECTALKQRYARDFERALERRPF